MRNIIKTTVLILVLAIPTLAGEIGNPIAPPDEPGTPNVSNTTSSAKTGNIGCPIAGSEIAMSLLQSLLALF
jgi:hypothetical protein